MSKHVIGINKFQTTDATPVTKKLFNLNEVSGWFEVEVVARATDGTSGGWYFKQFAKHTGAGGVVLVGSQNTDVAKDAGAATWDCDVTNDTTTIKVLLNGQTATIINWEIMVSLFKFE